MTIGLFTPDLIEVQFTYAASNIPCVWCKVYEEFGQLFQIDNQDLQSQDFQAVS